MLFEKVKEYFDDSAALLLDTGGVDIVICPEEISVRPALPKNSGVPPREWFGICMALTIPETLTLQAIKELIEDIEPLVQKAYEGADEKWTGSKWVGDWSEDALKAVEEAWKIIEEYEDDDRNHAHILEPIEAILNNLLYCVESVEHIWMPDCPEEARAYVRNGEVEALAKCIYDYFKDEFGIRGGIPAIERELEQLWENENCEDEC